MEISGVSSVGNFFYPQSGNITKPEAVQAMNKDQMIQILNYMLYQQNGLSLKLVRIATENFLKAQMNLMA
ncbi:MAG: hypothetical protein WHT65_10310 [Pseudothermotoga sp.]